ncbi:uncharacterized protein LOC108683467 [Hyalella azteca]|uniref:Uncharacterized protein LOC108683467 n=1 Tax=Hyalella azteca TaxID=294128 RepID=A0A8B7PQJ4_HYAAZ|nr:uncharacterized protein LOC108683467 [Hyalella azteca]XP_047739047.1 uncharacterized protein LOC108683467 [Hyalella azteca]
MQRLRLPLASVLLQLLCLAAAQEGAVAARCGRRCVNRYGMEICCDDTPLNSELRCPPMPRILPDCNDPILVVKDIGPKKCLSDRDCSSDQRCCPDTCDPDATICMPGQRNLHFLFP